MVEAVRTCLQCGIEFKPFRHQKFCSTKCRTKAWANVTRLNDVDFRRLKKEVTETVLRAIDPILAKYDERLVNLEAGLEESDEGEEGDGG